MNYMEWIPQPCLCMLVGFNEGFSGAVSQWLTKVQPSQLQGVAGASWIETTLYYRRE